AYERQSIEARSLAMRLLDNAMLVAGSSGTWDQSTEPVDAGFVESNGSDPPVRGLSSDGSNGSCPGSLGRSTLQNVPMDVR
ncbi:MAG: hypothetical protein MKZ77_07005, partial [Acidimicrobiales bacterium]|nr:hypothetical protein [Acidimicrobiales bacterium]